MASGRKHFSATQVIKKVEGPRCMFWSLCFFSLALLYISLLNLTIQLHQIEVVAIMTLGSYTSQHYQATVKYKPFHTLNGYWWWQAHILCIQNQSAILFYQKKKTLFVDNVLPISHLEPTLPVIQLHHQSQIGMCQAWSG